MTQFTYPSDAFPGPPQLELELPDDWEPAAVADVAVAARRLPRAQEFTPNIVIRLGTRSSEYSLTDSLTEVRDYARGQREGVASEPFRAELGGVQFVGCDVSWIDDEAGTLLQAHLFGLLDNGVGQDLVQLTGSVGGSRAQEDYPVIKEILGSVRVAR